MNHIQSPATGDQAIERAIVNAGANVAPRVTPADIEAAIVSEHYFTARQGVSGAAGVTDEMVSRFLCWPVPASVYPDGTPGQPGRVGTNLLSAIEARDMLEYVHASTPAGPLELLTFCVLVLRNGFTVTGESACASPENFDAGIGRLLARDNAVAKVWPLMGYELRSKLSAT